MDHLIRKRNGETAPFDPAKLETSLLNAGATDEDVQRISRLVLQQLTDGMSTHALYKMAYAQLRKKSHHVAGRYRLKKAIMELGPTGFPFEQLVGEIFRSEGYSVKVGIVEQGHCVSHELDVVAERGDTRVMVECKFHNDIRRKSDVKVPLYIQSRFRDMVAAWSAQDGDRNMNYEGWVVTNTRFTDDAVQYGRCAGLHLVSWDFPAGHGLRELIDRSGFHPVTALYSMTKTEKAQLMDMGIILCRQLLSYPESLLKLGKNEKQRQKILDEALLIVNGGG